MTVTLAGSQSREALGKTLWSALGAPAASLGLGALAVLTITLTYLTIGGRMPFSPTPDIVLALVIVNFFVLMVLVALIAVQLANMWNQRRSGLAGSRLHARLVAIFSAIAIVPAVMTAAFAAYTINLGMEAWFSQGVKTALDKSLAVAEGYLEEHQRNIRSDVQALAADFREIQDVLRSRQFDPFGFAEWFRRKAGMRALDGAAVFTGTGQMIETVLPGFANSVPEPNDNDFAVANAGNVSLSTDPNGTQVRAFMKLQDLPDQYLMVVRLVDKRVVGYLEETQQAVADYNTLSASRTEAQITLGLVYAIVALTLLIGSVFAGVWAANRIVSPISRLVSAAERVSRGDLTARVPMDRSDDEVATLTFAFNRMTGELESQREELVESHRQTEVRRRFTEAVLSGVSAGVIGLDSNGRVDILNRSAQTMLALGRDPVIGLELGQVAPELGPLFKVAQDNPEGRAQGQIDVARNGKTRNLTVRVTSETPVEGERGFVVTFDDITDLITAQRSSAWADVARRIAHEIKNPLTPIQLSAERLRRKYKKEITTDPEVFEQCTQTIIRQVSDIGRMVDEFSSFARMPQPVMRQEDIGELVRHATFLQRVALAQIAFDLVLPERPTMLISDGRLVSQALTNVLKNAGESVKAKFAPEGAKDPEPDQIQPGGRIEIRILESPDTLTVEVTDNGVGLPKEDRHRLTEPYVTKRAKGTGLGLAIVNKIMDDHGGRILLEDAPSLDATGAPRASGARVRLEFSRSLKPASASEQTLSAGTGHADEQSRAPHSV
jgi:two-component system, NtrC family, nitrogen regulation sensor histidine kinase NtrY